VTVPGEMTYARAYVEDGQLKMIVGKQEVKQYSPSQTQELLDATTPEWPIAAAVKETPMHVIMGDFPSNHEAGCYGDHVGEMVACCDRLGIPTRIYHA
jgi:L-fucose isomerase